MHETLLVRYIKEELRGYKEPERKGTPKGDPIGFSAKKYKTVLLSLTSMKVEEIAKEVNVSYGLLRVWRTEQHYKKTLEEHTRHFARLFAEDLLFLMEKRRVVIPERKDDYALALLPSDYLRFKDVTIFNKNLLQAVYDQIRLLVKNNLETWQKQKTYLSMAGEVFSIRKGYITYTAEGSREVKKDSPIVHEDSSGVILFDFVGIFEKPWQSDPVIAERDKNLFIKAIRDVL